jgi:hypothetical protein
VFPNKANFPATESRDTSWTGDNRTLIMDFTTWTVTHVRFGCSHLHPLIGQPAQLTHTRRSEGAPDPDGTLKESVRIKMRH